MVQAVELADGETVPMLGAVAKVDGPQLTTRIPPPKLGSNTETILKQRLGYDEEKIATLRAQGVV